jgi:hypothetical protein
MGGAFVGADAAEDLPEARRRAPAVWWTAADGTRT